MTRPVVSATAEDVYENLGPWTVPDEEQDWPLLKFVDLLTRPLHEMNELVRDTDDYMGWGKLLDADVVPAKYLPWLAQFAGVVLNTNLSAAAQRQQLKETAGFKRGTVGAIAAAAKPYLTGTKTVMIDERDTSAYHFRVRTFSAETPDPVAVEAALRAQKPAGLVMSYLVVDGLTWDEIKASGKTYDELSAEFGTSDAMKHAQSV